MRKLLTPVNFLLYFLSIVTFFLLGATCAAITGAAEGQGLAGGAIVFGYAIMFSAIGLIAALFTAYRAEQKTIVITNWILVVLLLVLIGITYFRFQKRKAEHAATDKSTKDIALGTLQFTSSHLPQEAEIPMGLGMFKPHFNETPVLYFYGNLNLEKPVQDHPPTDSIVFKQVEYGGYDIAYAPSYLVPAHLKPDYDILYFRIVSVGRDFAEIIVNTQTQQTAFVNRYAGTILYWPDFFLNVFSVEFPEGKQQPIRIKPLAHASEVTISYEFMSPLEIQDEWMRVQLMDNNANPVGKGWIPWRKENELLIEYSLLS